MQHLRRKFHEIVINAVLSFIYNAVNKRPAGKLTQVHLWYVMH